MKLLFAVLNKLCVAAEIEGYKEPPVSFTESPPAARRRHSSTHLRAALFLSLLLVLASAPASHAVLLVVDGGGIDGAVGCSTAGCIGTETFELGAPALVSGSIEIDPIGLTIGFDLHVTAVSLTESVAGTEDNGVAEVEFTEVDYSATGLPITEGIPNSFSIGFGSKALIEGAQTQWNDVHVAVNGTPAMFTQTEALITGNCLLVDPTNAVCSFSFGTAGFALDVGDPTPAPRHFRHTMSLVALDPPSTPVPAMGAGGIALLSVLLFVGAIFVLRSRRAGEPIH